MLLNNLLVFVCLIDFVEWKEATTGCGCLDVSKE